MRKEERDGTIRFLEGLAEISKAVMERNYLDDILSLIVSVIVSVTAKVTGSKICSILLLDRKSPKHQKAKVLERTVEPERVILFRVPWVDDKGEIRQGRRFYQLCERCEHRWFCQGCGCYD